MKRILIIPVRWRESTQCRGVCGSADEVLMLPTPEPSALIDAYAMIKAILPSAMTPSPHGYQHGGQSQQAFAVMTNLEPVRQHIPWACLVYLGHIIRDPHVAQSVIVTYPFFVAVPECSGGQVCRGYRINDSAPMRAG